MDRAQLIERHRELFKTIRTLQEDFLRKYGDGEKYEELQSISCLESGEYCPIAQGEEETCDLEYVKECIDELENTYKEMENYILECKPKKKKRQYKKRESKKRKAEDEVSTASTATCSDGKKKMKKAEYEVKMEKLKTESVSLLFNHMERICSLLKNPSKEVDIDSEIKTYKEVRNLYANFEPALDNILKDNKL